MSIKIMIVDDALFIRAVLRNIFESDPEKRFEVVATATDGEDALRKLQTTDVDVVTLDIEMPRKNGLETLEEIMKSKPIPVVMLSSLTQAGAKETIQALSLGAVDFVAKPSQKHEDVSNLKNEIREKVYHASKINRKKIEVVETKKTFSSSTPKQNNSGLTNLIVIGCSTGGPKALQKELSLIPKNLPAGILIVQHMPEGGYTASLANHLNQVSEFDVKEAQNGDEVLDGKVYIAPGGFHMEILKKGAKYQIVLNKKGPVTGHRPSVDALFSSVASIEPEMPVYGVIMTGMGSDGTAGVQALKEMKKQKTIIVAESKTTAIVYGMPRQVVERNLADYVEDLGNIILKVSKLISKK